MTPEGDSDQRGGVIHVFVLQKGLGYQVSIYSSQKRHWCCFLMNTSCSTRLLKLRPKTQHLNKFPTSGMLFLPIFVALITSDSQTVIWAVLEQQHILLLLRPHRYSELALPQRFSRKLWLLGTWRIEWKLLIGTRSCRSLEGAHKAARDAAATLFELGGFMSFSDKSCYLGLESDTTPFAGISLGLFCSQPWALLESVPVVSCKFMKMGF